MLPDKGIDLVLPNAYSRCAPSRLFNVHASRRGTNDILSGSCCARGSGEETTDEYVSRAEELQAQLTENERPVLADVLIDRIVNGLPDAFNPAKVSLRIMAEGKWIDDLRASKRLQSRKYS